MAMKVGDKVHRDEAKKHFRRHELLKALNFVKRVLFALVASFVTSALSESVERAKIRVTTWNLEHTRESSM